VTARASALLGGLLMLAVVGLWTRAVPVPSAVRHEPPPRPSTAPPAARPAIPLPVRNPFDFEAEGAASRPQARDGVSEAAPVPSPMPSEAPVHLVGLVLRAGRPAAALSIFGAVEVAGVGETVAGYTVIAVDPEGGVRLKGPGGEAISLPSPAGGLPEGP
jgi:hypothetical protein